MGSTRLDVHVKKGLVDGLYISSVGCASDLWGIIMDAGTGFTNQLYRVVPEAFLPKEWIMEKWDLGYYITAVAGAVLKLLVLSHWNTIADVCSQAHNSCMHALT